MELTKLAIAIKQRREELGLTQRELASKINTTQNYICSIEAALVEPRFTRLQKIAEALGCDIRYLL